LSPSILFWQIDSGSHIVEAALVSKSILRWKNNTQFVKNLDLFAQPPQVNLARIKSSCVKLNERANVKPKQKTRKSKQKFIFFFLDFCVWIFGIFVLIS
jgi:hypothetical protein